VGTFGQNGGFLFLRGSRRLRGRSLWRKRGEFSSEDEKEAEYSGAKGRRSSYLRINIFYVHVI